MKCPLFVMSYMQKVGEAPTHQAECLKEECAWGDKEHDTCRLCTISEELSSIQWELQELRQKMPHEEQFRR